MDNKCRGANKRKMCRVMLLAGFVYASSAYSGNFVGFSAGALDGGNGIYNMNQECIDTYGEGHKLCSSRDILWSPQPAVKPSGGFFAWVRPTYIAPDFDASGQTGSSLSCSGWRSNGESLHGLVVSQNLEFMPTSSISLGNCSSELVVACCKSSAGYRIAPN
jgi:hypothetical protein